MDQLANELAELKGFITELKADRAATKAKEKKEAWTKHTSLSIVFIAVLAAVASQWGGKFSSHTLISLNESTFKQAKASDQWGYYQAKSIKQRVAESERDLLAKTIDPASPAGKSESAKMEAKIATYGQEMAEITKQAKALEQERDEARASADHSSLQGGVMGTSVSIFQIAIALGSICLVVKRKELWYLSLAVSILASVEMIRAWYS